MLKVGCAPLPASAAVRRSPRDSVTWRVPWKLLAVGGVKVTSIVQDAAAASVAGQLLVWAKLPPPLVEKPIPVRVRLVAPSFAKVKANGALVVVTTWSA